MIKLFSHLHLQPRIFGFDDIAFEVKNLLKQTLHTETAADSWLPEVVATSQSQPTGQQSTLDHSSPLQQKKCSKFFNVLSQYECIQQCS